MGIVDWFKKWRHSSVNSGHAMHQPLMSQADIRQWGQTIEAYFASLSPSQRLSELSLLGDQVSRFRGQGMEYEESRGYQPGDELRHLNWRLMARTGKPSTKLFQEDRQAQWVILLDQRQAMRFATRGRLKVEQGLRLAGWLAWIAQRQGIKLQALGLSEQLQVSPILEGRQLYPAVMQHFNQPCPRRDHIIEPSFLDVIQGSSQHWPSGSRIWLISDFADIEPAHQAWLAQINHRWQLSAVAIYDPVEQQLNAKQSLSLAAQGQVYKLNAQQQQDYNHWARSHNPLQTLKRAGLDTFSFSTVDSLLGHPFLAKASA
ncbi:DUF58 domain-containing protein [Thiomicrospira microaerophila]|uniref:DUF58 domain-containing protein n=1 Tax=Thiomicrospira microaerophila TaxID=406020 RepID=UPI00200C4B3A|nr:DUF58 domain-containing protein [Thiomicrospira microaerophila]UQB42237.1 DUF58 domain-containing protein [Thiomicrospira microaerophila]